MIYKKPIYAMFTVARTNKTKNHNNNMDSHFEIRIILYVNKLITLLSDQI